MTNEEYWKKRSELNFQMGEKTVSELLETMKTVYREASLGIKKEIEAFYGRYAKNNNMTLAEVRKRLDPSELLSHKQELKKYYNLADPSKIGKNMAAEYRKQLRLQSAKSYISRLEELKANLKDIVVHLGAEEQNGLRKTLETIYENNYSHFLFDLDKFRGFSMGYKNFSPKVLNEAVQQKWNENNYSDRVWKNKDKLLNQLDTTFLQGVARGQNPKKIAEEMSKNINSGYKNCERLARTEMAYAAGQSTSRGYKDCGIDKYQFLATLDHRTSLICQTMDGQVFDIKDLNVGINYPPLHPNCRSTTIPYFEKDEIDLMFDDATRIAKDEGGKWYEVPASTTYRDWLDIAKNQEGKPFYIPSKDFVAEDYREKYQDKNITPDEKGVNYFVENYLEDKSLAEEIEKANKEIQDFINKNGISQDINTPERLELREKIINSFFDNIESKKPKNGKPELVMLGGRGGSGKSWFTDEFIGMYKKENYVYIDSDEIKKHLPVVVNGKQLRDENGNLIFGAGKYAGFVHKESSSIATAIQDKAKELGCNVIIDGTMSNNWAITDMTDFKNAGYKVACDYMFMPLQLSMKSACDRYKKSGRFVPLINLANMQRNEKIFDEAIKKKLNNGEQLVDRYSFRDNKPNKESDWKLKPYIVTSKGYEKVDVSKKKIK